MGLLWRIFILEMSTPPLVLINPQIEDMDDSRVPGREGCLSIPGYMSYKVPRAPCLKVTGYDHRLEPVTLEVADEVARGVQHEYDHLDGGLYIDRLVSLADLEPSPDSWLARSSRTLDTYFPTAPAWPEPRTPQL